MCCCSQVEVSILAVGVLARLLRGHPIAIASVVRQLLFWGHKHEQRISPLIVFISYPPFNLKKIGMYEAHLGLSGQPKHV